MREITRTMDQTTTPEKALRALARRAEGLPFYEVTCPACAGEFTTQRKGEQACPGCGVRVEVVRET